MSGRPWYAFYPEPYIRDTAHLTLAQDGAYRRMLDHYYRTEKPLPPQLDAVQRIARASSSDERKAVSAVLSEFFRLENDGWHNDRADAELLAASEIYESRRKSASNAAAKRWQAHPQRNASRNASRMPDAMPDAMPERCVDDAHIQTQGLEPDGSKPKARSRAPVLLPEGVSQQLWQDFREHRRRLRAPMTDRAEAILLKQITDLQRQGHDPTALIEQSIARGWKGIFAGDSGNGGERKRTSTNSHLAGIAELVREGRERTNGDGNGGESGEG